MYELRGFHFNNSLFIYLTIMLSLHVIETNHIVMIFSNYIITLIKSSNVQNEGYRYRHNKKDILDSIMYYLLPTQQNNGEFRHKLFKCRSFENVGIVYEMSRCC